MKTYYIYAKQDEKWQRKGIQGEPTPPECGGTVEGTAIPVGVPVEKIYFNTALSVEETDAYLSQLSYVQTDLFEYPIYVVWGCVDGDGNPMGIIAQADMSTNHFIIQAIDMSSTSAGMIKRKLYDNQEDEEVNLFPQFNNGYTYELARGLKWLVLNGGIYLDIMDKTPINDFNGLPVGAENEKIKNVLSITPFGASGGSVDVEDSGLPVEVSTQEAIDALAIGTIFKYTGESGTYENGALYLVESTELTFTILGEKLIEYKALKGMTWAEFVDSSYNDGRVYIGKYQPTPGNYTPDDRVLYRNRLEDEKDGFYALYNPAADDYTQKPDTLIVDGAEYLSATG